MMQRYGGTLIHSSRDEDGIIEVVDVCGVRSLHFGTPPKQSSLSLSQPTNLELPYVRAMTSALMFHDQPSSVLILGLGGGSLANFFLNKFSKCSVVAVELRSQVVDIAREYFNLPDDPRLSLHVSDACAFVYGKAKSQRFLYDLILVDAYDHVGMDPQINAETFFRSCQQLLAPGGVFTINLWGTHRQSLQKSTQLMKKIFGAKCFKLAVPSRGNVIGFGLQDDATVTVIQQLSAKALELEVRLGIEMRNFLNRLKPM